MHFFTRGCATKGAFFGVLSCTVFSSVAFLVARWLHGWLRAKALAAKILRLIGCVLVAGMVARAFLKIVLVAQLHP
jgi:hypothetical protein